MNKLFISNRIETKQSRAVLKQCSSYQTFVKYR